MSQGSSAAATGWTEQVTDNPGHVLVSTADSDVKSTYGLNISGNRLMMLADLNTSTVK
jgi:hypothetical protein